MVKQKNRGALSKTAFNDVTGHNISTAVSNTDRQVYAEEYEKIFGKQEEKVRINPRYYPEDVDEHGDGIYENMCLTCEKTFYGGKHRLTCKLCRRPNEDSV